MNGRDPRAGNGSVPTLPKGAAPFHDLVRRPAAAFGAALVLQATALGPGQLNLNVRFEGL